MVGAVRFELTKESPRRSLQDGLEPLGPASGLKTTVSDCIQRGAAASTNGKLSLHVPPGDAPDLNPDERAWRHVKRSGVTRKLRHAGKTLSIRVDPPLRDMQEHRRLVR